MKYPCGSMPTLHGQTISTRLFDPMSGVRSAKELGYDDTELKISQRTITPAIGSDSDR